MKSVLSLGAVLLPFMAQAGDLTVSDAYAFSPNPSAPTGAVFMRIENAGENAVRLIDVKGDAAKKIEIHTSQMQDDVMKMMHLDDGLEVPAQGCVALERGGYHVMLMGLIAPLEQGDNLALTLQFDNGEELAVEVPVDLEHDTATGEDHCLRASQMMGH